MTARANAARRPNWPGTQLVRRRFVGFFDFRNFSDLQGFEEGDRTAAERDRNAEEMSWNRR